MKTFNKWMLIAMVAAILGGCGEGQKENTSAVPVPTTNTILNQLGTGGLVSPFSTTRQEGMFDGIGQEQLQTQPGQINQPYPAVKYWHTRIEFLKQDGSNVDPATFSLNMPIFSQHIRITLIADGAQAIKYIADGSVWVYQSKGYALGNLDGNPVRVYNQNSATPLFDVSFGDAFSTGPMLGILARRGGLYGGTIILTDQTGKHTIRY